MRKLSKKISMLMVLAMLVSLFSGIVSASAASSWSFYNKTTDEIVAVKETIEMESNEFADFDLYKDGKTIDTDIYTVKYESDDADVVWVDAKNGKLRADKAGKAEAGDKAMITAVITNKTTNVTARRSFFIEIAADEEVEYAMTVNYGDETLVVGEKYDLKAVVTADGKEVAADVAFSIDGKAIEGAYAPAEAGEYTIVAVATVDGEEVAKVETKVVVEAVGLVAAKQIAYNAVALTFGSADVAKAVAADASKINAVWVAVGDNEITTFISGVKVDDKNEKVVNVTLYNSLIKDITYKFTFADDSASVVGADLTKYAAIAIADPTIDKGDLKDITINVYDANGIHVTTLTDGFIVNAAESGDYYVAGDDIYFYEAGKSANVEIILPMGYDTNGNKIEDIKTTGTLVSVDKSGLSVSAIKSFSIDNCNNMANSFTVAVGENKTLSYKYDEINYWGNVTEKKSNEKAYADYGYVMSYKTTNDAILLVDEFTGDVFPVAAGTAQVVVYRAPNWNQTATEMIGVCTFNVIGNRVLNGMNPELSKTKLSDSPDDVVTVYPNAVDQTNSGYTPIYNIELISAADGVSVSLIQAGGNVVLAKDPYGNGAVVTASRLQDGWKAAFDFVADSALDYATTVQIAITATAQDYTKSIMKVVTLSVKAAGNESYYALDSVSGAIDLNIPGKQWWAGIDNYFSTEIKLNAYDSQGYLVKTYAGDELDNGEGTNNFFYTIKKGNTEFATTNDKFYAITEATVSGSTQLVKIDDGKVGTYTVRAYKKVDNAEAKLVATKNIVVTDSTVGLSVTQKSNKLTTAQSLNLNGLIADGKLEFKRSGNGVTLTIVDVDATINRLSNGETRVYVTKVKVSETYDGFGTFEWWVNVGKVFEVED